MFDITLGGAALAGLLSFLTPCILPMVPFYLAYMAGTNIQALTAEGSLPPAIRLRAVLSATLFAAGVITIFVGLGAAATVFGQFVRDWLDVLRYLAAALIVAMGLHFVGLLRIPILYRQIRADGGMGRPVGYFGAYLMGLAFAFGWTPCVGPVLAAILMTAAGAESTGRGVELLFVYGLGMTLPFIVAALFVGPFLRWAAGFRRYLGLMERIMGGFLILFGILIATNTVNYIAQWMLSVAPDIGILR